MNPFILMSTITIIITMMNMSAISPCAVPLEVHWSEQGRGWQPGQVKQVLQKLVDSYSSIPKTPSYVYSGGNIGQSASKLEPALPLVAAHTLLS